jgi:hypothetical protein
MMWTEGAERTWFEIFISELHRSHQVVERAEFGRYSSIAQVIQASYAPPLEFPMQVSHVSAVCNK